jgi:WD40 repeat protein
MNGQCVTTISGNQGEIHSLAFSPDGELLGTGGEDGSVKLWNKNGINITTISSNQNSIISITFNPDGKLVATNGYDGTTKFWDIAGNQIGQFDGGLPVAISPDWQVIAIATRQSYFGGYLTDDPLYNTQVNLYRIDLNLDSLLRRACQRLKPYILSDPNQKTEQSQCEQHLGESWESERIVK